MRFTLYIIAMIAGLQLTGCGIGVLAPACPVRPVAIQGKVHGGQQAVVGAHVYLYAANTAGYNIGAATYASVSLLNSSVLTNEPSNSGKDASGNYYVTTDATGSFNISNDYTCTPGLNGVPGQQIYLYAVGGNPGSGNNPVASFMAVLGDCPATGNFSATVPYVWVNEVSTVAAAYAIAGFAYDATHVSSSATNLAKVGIENAFANASNLVTLATGVPLTVTPAGNGTVPQSLIITLANTLAACVNSTGLLTGPPTPTTCYTLFTNAESNGSTGTAPSDTATAMINIAHNPGTNVNALYVLQTGMPAFGKGLTTQPNDFTMGINFTGGGLNNVFYFALDSSGNVWAPNDDAYSVSKFSNVGTVLSGTSGYTGGGLKYPSSVAIDNSGYMWATNDWSSGGISKLTNGGVPVSPSPYGFIGGGVYYPSFLAIDGLGYIWVLNDPPGNANFLSKFTSLGGPVSGSGFAGGGLLAAQPMAIDGSGNVWVTNTGDSDLVEFSNTGTVLSGSGYNGGGLDFPDGIAIDASGDVWVTNDQNPGTLSKFSNAGVALSGSGYTGGGLTYPNVVAIDGAGNVWVSNFYTNTVSFNGSVSEFSSAGIPLSPSTGYTNGEMQYSGDIAIDGSGDVWVADSLYANSITELVGAATPVVTPLCAGLPATPTADGSSKLGTRP